MNKKQQRIVHAVTQEGYKLGHNAGNWILYRESKKKYSKHESEHQNHKECENLLKSGAIRQSGHFAIPGGIMFENYVPVDVPAAVTS